MTRNERVEEANKRSRSLSLFSRRIYGDLSLALIETSGGRENGESGRTSPHRACETFACVYVRASSSYKARDKVRVLEKRDENQPRVVNVLRKKNRKNQTNLVIILLSSNKLHHESRI